MGVGEHVLETQGLRVKKVEGHWVKHMILCIKLALIHWMNGLSDIMPVWIKLYTR